MSSIYRYSVDSDTPGVKLVHLGEPPGGRQTYRVAEDLFDFLNGNSCTLQEWDSFWNAMYKYGQTGEGDGDYLTESFGDAFTWEDTDQGHDYWSDLEHRFYDHLDSGSSTSSKRVKFGGNAPRSDITPETYEVL